MNIICFAKQVMDPETPLASFKIDEANNTVMPVQGVAPVVNGFDENAIEAALQLREEHEGTIQVISLGKDLVLDVMKKPLSMGADELYLLQDDALEEGDAYSIARALTAAVKKIGDFDLILCGRQASDTDRGQVGPAVAEMLGIPVVTLARGITVSEGRVTVERVRQDGSEIMEAPLPAMVTVSNEFGEPRYPTLRGIMQAGRKQPTIWSAADIGADSASVGASGRVVDLDKLFIPVVEKNVEWIDGDNGAEKGRNLALKLREAKLI